MPRDPSTLSPDPGGKERNGGMKDTMPQRGDPPERNMVVYVDSLRGMPPQMGDPGWKGESKGKGSSCRRTI